MSNIAAISGTSSTESTTSSPGLKGTQDEFLRLFMAQLQHQDPFAPTSGADMVAQLAQLSGVEQAKQTNDKLAELAAQQSSAASASLSSLVGRDCRASAGAFRLETGGPPPPIDVSSPTAMKGAAIVISDASGKQLRRIPVPDGTSATVAWDGRDASGRPMAPGTYAITVDAGNSPSTITPQWHGRVDAVELTAEGPRLRMGGVLLMPGDIRTIGGTPAPTTTNPTSPSTPATTPSTNGAQA